MTTTAIYCRISRDRNEEGLGVQRQEADCRALCERNGWDDVTVYIDNDISAFTAAKKRPEYLRMLDDVKNRVVDRIIAWHPDRLHRSMKELEAFIDVVEETRCEVATVTAGNYDLSNPEGRMIARILGSVARAESEHKSRRILRKHEELAANGKPSGGGIRPYGYQRVLRNGHIIEQVVVADEAAVIRDAMRRFLAGEALRSITADLNRRDIPTVQGGHWTAPSLRGVLKSGRISGQREHHGRIIGPADWPAIVTPEDTARARALLDDNAARRTRTPRVYLLAGMVRCGKCGTRLVGSGRANRLAGYSCPTDYTRPGCGAVSILAHLLEPLIVEALFEAVDTPALRVVDDTPLALDELQTAQAQLEELAGAYGKQAITLTEWLAARKPIEARIANANRALAETPRDVTAYAYRGQAAELRGDWPGLGIAERRAILATFIDTILLQPRTIGRPRFDAERVEITWRV